MPGRGAARLRAGTREDFDPLGFCALVDFETESHGAEASPTLDI